MHRTLLGGITAVLLAVMLLSGIHPASAGPLDQAPSPVLTLSPYWSPAVQRWERIILEQAESRGLDPDLIAALIWKESLGRPYARGPAGAVGLMMVMPREAGFSWRPTARALEDPETNVFWGARALATVISQSRGDLYAALAAYNGGWDQVHLAGPQRYAASVMSSYAQAVAVRYGLAPEGHWVGTFAPTDTDGVLNVVGPQRPLVRYSLRPVVVGIPDVLVDGRPSAVVFQPTAGGGLGSPVGLWIVLDGRLIGGSAIAPLDGETVNPPALPRPAEA